MDFNLDRVAANMTRNMLGTDITSNNLANIGTTGFKRDATFTDWYMEALEEGSSQGFTNFDQGELELTVSGQTWVLGPGDSYYFDSRLPHRFRNTGKKPARIVSANTPPSI